MMFFIVVFITYIIASLFGYVVHWALHQTWMGSINQAHMTHHQKLYPPEDFLSDSYRKAEKDSSPKFFAVAAIPLIVAPIILFVVGILPFYLLLTVLMVEGLMGFFHDYLHDAFHIRNHWLTRAPGVQVIFHGWSRLHYLHHVRMESNYGIFFFVWDRMFSTFRDK